MTKEKLYLFWRSRAKDEYCNRVGMGVAMCYPSAIGLTKDEYMHYPKNTGDDEITAIWA